MPHNSVLSTFPFLFHLLNSPLIYAPRRFLKSRSYFALDAKHCCKEGKVDTHTNEKHFHVSKCAKSGVDHKASHKNRLEGQVD